MRAESPGHANASSAGASKPRCLIWDSPADQSGGNQSSAPHCIIAPILSALNLAPCGTQVTQAWKLKTHAVFDQNNGIFHITMFPPLLVLIQVKSICAIYPWNMPINPVYWRNFMSKSTCVNWGLWLETIHGCMMHNSRKYNRTTRSWEKENESMISMLCI